MKVRSRRSEPKQLRRFLAAFQRGGRRAVGRGPGDFRVATGRQSRGGRWVRGGDCKARGKCDCRATGTLVVYDRYGAKAVELRVGV